MHYDVLSHAGKIYCEKYSVAKIDVLVADNACYYIIGIFKEYFYRELKKCSFRQKKKGISRKAERREVKSYIAITTL